MEPEPQSTSVRQQFVFPASLSQRLEAMAEHQGLTKSELVRRAVEAYDPELEGISEADLREMLGDLRAAVSQATDKLNVLISDLHSWPAQRDADRAAARAEAEAWAAEHPDAVDAVAALLEGTS